MLAFERFKEAAEAAGCRVKQTGPGVAVATCPAHDDQNPSLALRQIREQLLVHCHAGCDIGDVLAALELRPRDLFDQAQGTSYDYYDTDGALLRQVFRTPGKRFRQDVRDRSKVTLYRLPQVLEAVAAARVVWLVEGEKDADVLVTLGEEATSAPQGASHFDLVDVRPLRGAVVHAVVDLDESGRKWAAAVYAGLEGTVASLVFYKPVEGKDLADHIMAGHTLEELVPLTGDELPVDPLELVRQRFPRLDLAALLTDGRPARQFVVDGLVPVGASVSVVGPAGTGKSLFVLALVLAVARRDPTFAGIPITGRRVLLIDMENSPDDLADRLTALGVSPDDLDRLHGLVILNLPPLMPLDTAAGAAELVLILDAYEMQPGDVLVLDSLQRVIGGPENDSDTLRAFYRHTATMLKQRGLTVLRTDNAGKDPEKGARGTSGKRDDVDVELLMTRDAEQPQLRLRPGKARVDGIAPVLIKQHTDDDGRLIYSAAGDPFRMAVAQAIRWLDELDVPLSAGERVSAAALKDAKKKVVRAALRAAVKERRDALIGAPWAAAHLTTRSGVSTAPSMNGAPTAHPTETPESERENRAAQTRRTNRATRQPVPATGAPLSALSIESGAPGAPSPNEAIELARDVLGGTVLEDEETKTSSPEADPR